MSWEPEDHRLDRDEARGMAPCDGIRRHVPVHDQTRTEVYVKELVPSLSRTL